MNFLKITSCFIVVMCCVTASSAQYYQQGRPELEWHAGWGTTAFFGDIGGTSRSGANISGLDGTDLSTVNPAYIVGLRKNFNPHVALRTSLLSSRVEGADYNAADPSRRIRNLSFNTSILEASVQLEYSLINFLKNSKKKSILEYYIFGGIGAVHFNPKTVYNNQWVELQPLGTEGQGLIEGTRLYNRVTGVFPVGGGLRFSLKHSVMIFGEVTYHQTTSDYLDDVSGFYYNYSALANERGEVAAALSYRGGAGEYPNNGGRGNPDSKDGYLTISLGISKALGKDNSGATPNYPDLYNDEDKF